MFWTIWVKLNDLNGMIQMDWSKWNKFKLRDLNQMI